MADLKISQLTGASTPLAGTEVLPIVQSGSTKKVSVADLTAGRPVAMAGGSFTDNITQNTAGKGFNFTANANAPGMTSELLNWYEEGTFTPVIVGTSTAGTGTYVTQLGRYTRVGRVVHVQVQLRWSAHTGTGDMNVNGLPFTSANVIQSQMAVGSYDVALTALNILSARQTPNTTQIELLQLPVGGGAWSAVPLDTSVVALEIAGFYIV
jgi:hypothetical protein